MGGHLGCRLLVLLLCLLPGTAWAEEAMGPAATLIRSLQELAAALSAKLAMIGQALAAFDQHLGTVRFLLESESGAGGLAHALWVLPLLIAVALAAELLLWRGTGSLRRRLLAGEATGWLGKLRAIALVFAFDLLHCALFFVVTHIGSLLFFKSVDPLRELLVAVFLAIVATRLAAAVSCLLLSPGAPGRRLVQLDDRAARRHQRCAMLAAALITTGFFGGGLLLLVGLPPELVQLWDLLFGALLALLLAVWVWLAGGLWLLRVAALLICWLLWSLQLLADHPLAAQSAALALALILLAPVVARLIEAAVEGRRLRRLLSGMVQALAFAAALFYLLDALGLGLRRGMGSAGGQAAGQAVVSIVVAVILGLLASEISRRLVEKRLGPLAASGGGDDEAIVAGSRAHTLLPLLRSVVMGIVVVVVALIVLSALGLDIEPLLTGAGIVGIAIGFGAQTLVRDIFSGFFFLLDDAFRVGEYIDVKVAKGTVERITIRSVQLRHHRGALATVPYGEINAIQNMTRDWVIEKLEFGLVYGTDVERVRKVIKQVGKDFADDPTVQSHLLETLKSQGVQRFADSAIIFRAKFKAVAGHQFVLRRNAYRRLIEAFAENEIRFAFPTVTISAGKGASEEPDEETLAAARSAMARTQAPPAG